MLSDSQLGKFFQLLSYIFTVSGAVKSIRVPRMERGRALSEVESIRVPRMEGGHALSEVESIRVPKMEGGCVLSEVESI